MKKSPFVVIMMPNYNSASIVYQGRSMLLSCLESLRRIRYDNYRVVVADNSSTDNSAEMVSRFRGVDFLIKRSKEEYGGIPRTNNFAIRQIMRKYNPEYILMFNTDMIVKDGLWVRKLVDLAESDRRIGLVTCKLVYPSGRIQHAGIITGFFPVNRGRGEVDRGQYDRIDEVDGTTTALVLIRTSILRKVGLFDERFYNGFDDTDFCLRVRKAGYRIMYNGKASIVHLEGFASASSPLTSVRDKSFYGHQTAYAYYAFKNFGAFDRARAIGALLARSILVYGIDTDTRSSRSTSIRFRDRKWWRLKTSVRAVFDGYGLYRAQLKGG